MLIFSMFKSKYSRWTSLFFLPKIGHQAKGPVSSGWRLEDLAHL